MNDTVGWNMITWGSKRGSKQKKDIENSEVEFFFKKKKEKKKKKNS